MSALERKVAIVTNKGTLYPSLYVILVGPAGAGKTIASSAAYDFLTKLDSHHIAPSSVTKASMMDELNEAKRTIIRPQDNPSVVNFNSLTIIANEFGVLVPAYDNEFINVLTDIYDCKRYSERRRTGDRKFSMAAPQMNILAATTPSYLNNLMPEGAWDQGFISRTMLVYSGHGEYVDLFDAIEPNVPLYEALLKDLTEIGDLFGNVKFSDEAVAAFRAWAASKFAPEPEHPKLIHYNSRRQQHLLKLCIAACVSTSNDLIVTVDHFAEALDWLTETEASMPDIFKAMSMGGSTRVIDEVWYYAYTEWMKKKKPIPEAILIEFISQRAPTHEVAKILEVMTKAGIFKLQHVAAIGVCYEPRPRK
jgi:hypothetical protein